MKASKFFKLGESSIFLTMIYMRDNNKEFFTHSSYVKFYVVTDENSSSPVSALFNTLSLQKQNTLQNAELF